MGCLEVLLGDEDTLTEEVFVDLLAIGLGDEPDNLVSACPGMNSIRDSRVGRCENASL